MADNVTITPGSGNIVAADEVTDGALGIVKVQYIKLMDGTLDGTDKLIISAAGAAKVDGSAVTQPVSGTFFQATQPISAVALPLPTGAATETTLALLNAKVTAVNTDAVTISAALPAGTNVIGHVITDTGSVVAVSNFPATQPISGTVTAVQATGANLHVVVDSAPTTAVTGPLTDTQLRAVAVPVSGTFFQVTQPVSGTVTSNQGTPAATANRWPIQLTDGTDLALVTAAGSLQVDGSGVTQPVSGTVTANAGSGTMAVSGPLTDTQLRATPVPISGSVTITDGSGPVTVDGTVAATQSGTWTVQPGNTANTTPWLTVQQAATLLVTATAATGVAVTATLPAVASQFHYITFIEITKMFTAANAASATPLVVTTTNLPGSYAVSFGQPLGTIGTQFSSIYSLPSPLKSSAVNTNTTIVCPATTGIIWRINVHYYTAV